METHSTPRTLGGGYLFGVPVKDLGWFASLLMGAASGFIAFFLGTFLGILGIALYNGTAHKNLDLAWSYKAVGLPLGILMLAIALGYLGLLWIKRKARSA